MKIQSAILGAITALLIIGCIVTFMTIGPDFTFGAIVGGFIVALWFDLLKDSV